MPPRGTSSDRLVELERQVLDLQNLVAQLHGRLGAPQAKRSGRYLGKIDSDTLGTGAATVSVWVHDGSAWGDAGWNITGVVPFGLGDEQTYEAGTWVDCFFYGSKWYATAAHPPKARWIYFSLDEALATSDANKTATVEAYWDGDDPDPGSSGVEVYNAPFGGGVYAWEAQSGTFGFAVWDDVADFYRITGLFCEPPE